MCCCSICSFVVGILSLLFLVASFPNSGIIQPLSNKIENNITGLINPSLKISNEHNLLNTQPVSFNLPSNNIIQSVPSEITIDNFTSIESILSAI